MPDVVKVTLNNETLIDISDSTVDSSKVLSSYVGYEGDGDRFVGAYTPPASVTVEPLSVTSNGTYTASSGSAYSPVTVNVPTGGGSSSEGGVKFIDYDGTILHEYTVEEFSELSALPANPTHTGLTSQGWNWTKAEIDAQLEDYPEILVVVGQLYVTADGKTRIYVRFEEGRSSPYLGLRVNGTVTIDWGDGSSAETCTGTSLSATKRVQHIYQAGDYIIELTPTSGSFGIAGHSYGSYILRPGTTNVQYTPQVYLSSIKKVELGTNVTLSSYAFSHCYSLQSITIPSYITTIPTYSFNFCYALQSITFPSGITSVLESVCNCCYNLLSAAVPSNTTRVDDSAFSGCFSLSLVCIPRGVTSIGTYTFNNCYTIQSITVIPDGVTTIGSYAFASCFSLKSVAILNGAVSIGTNAFYLCYSLHSFTIPSGVTSIPSKLFYNDFGLLSLHIPDTVTSIGSQAFYTCRALRSVNIPNGITSIEEGTFYSCSALQSVTIPNNVTTIGANSFNGCTVLASIIIPNSVTSIGSQAFNGCYSLQSVVLSDNITTIASSLFNGCGTLRSVTIPSGVTSIESYAFAYCRSLSSLTIPSNVTSIGTYAFSACYGMKEYHLQPATPPTLAHTNAFTNIQGDCIIYVPTESLEAYKTATNWSTYASYMQGE